MDFTTAFSLRGNDFVLISGVEEFIQRINKRLSTRLTEFFADTSIGLNWDIVTSRTLKNVPDEVILIEVQRAISEERDIQEIRDLNLVRTIQERKLTVSYTVVVNNQLISGGVTIG